jgi:hypothetical protein
MTQHIRLRFPADLWASLDAKILEVEAELKAEDTKGKGYTNADIGAKLVEYSSILFANFFAETVADVVARRISLVLGGGQDETLSFDDQGILPGIIVATHFSVPQADKTMPRWKRKRDCTPNDLTMVLLHREKIDEARAEVKASIEVLRETALRRGCKPDQPISSVGF